jgi:hypothetical protein
MQNRSSQEDLAYCAGLFDGEGCVQCKNYPKILKKGNLSKFGKWNIALEISMTDIEPLHYFLNVFKIGSIFYKKNTDNLSKKDLWRWRAASKNALAVAKLIYPYSIVKRKNLLKLINHYELNKPDASSQQTR